MSDQPNEETIERAKQAANEAIGYAMDAIDIRPDDYRPDQDKWAEVESRLADLLARAYVRNHDQ